MHKAKQTVKPHYIYFFLRLSSWSYIFFWAFQYKFFHLVDLLIPTRI